jgi:hypothetical protein
MAGANIFHEIVHDVATTGWVAPEMMVSINDRQLWLERRFLPLLSPRIYFG